MDQAQQSSQNNSGKQEVIPRPIDRLKDIEFSWWPYSGQSHERSLQEWRNSQPQTVIQAISNFLKAIPQQYAVQRKLGAFLGGSIVYHEAFWEERRHLAISENRTDLLKEAQQRGRDIDLFLGCDNAFYVGPLPNDRADRTLNSFLLSDLFQFAKRAEFKCRPQLTQHRNGTSLRHYQGIDRSQKGKLAIFTTAISPHREVKKGEALKVWVGGPKPVHVRHHYKELFSSRVLDERYYKTPMVVLFQNGEIKKAIEFLTSKS